MPKRKLKALATSDEREVGAPKRDSRCPQKPASVPKAKKSSNAAAFYCWREFKKSLLCGAGLRTAAGGVRRQGTVRSVYPPTSTVPPGGKTLVDFFSQRATAAAWAQKQRPPFEPPAHAVASLQKSFVSQPAWKPQWVKQPLQLFSQAES